MTVILKTHRGISFILFAFLILGAIYSVTTPLFEAGDEIWHYPYVQFVAQGNGLPVQDPARRQLWEQEGGQPPLYYLLSAAATFWADTSDLPARLWRNPFAKIGIPLAYGNKNLIVHTRAESFPWQGATLAVHLIRFLSLLFSAGTVLFTYLTAKLILTWRHPVPVPPLHRLTTSLPLFAAALVAFNPMFLFISASVNNDSLAALLATVALWQTVRIAAYGATSPRVLALGIVIGLAALTKVSTLALFGLAGSIIVYCAWREKNVRTLLRDGVLVLIPAVVVAGWWYLRNFQLYGDPLALNVWLQIAGGRDPQTLLGLLDEFQGFRISFWGNFGGVNIIAPEWVYTILDLFSLLAVAGIIAAWLRREIPPLLWIPLLWLAIVFAALVRWTLLTYASQGRLIFPAIAAVAILITYGLAEVSKSIRQALNSTLQVSGSRFQPSTFNLQPSISNLDSPIFNLQSFLVLFLLAFALAAPFLIIAPVYAQPVRLSADSAVPNPVHIKFNVDRAQPELVGYSVARQVRIGGELPITLYWRTDAQIPQDLYAYIHVYDVGGKLIGQWDALPGNGLYPPRVWQPNEIIVDTYRVPVTGAVQLPPVGRIEAGLAQIGSTRPLVAHDPTGQEITPNLGRFKIAGVNSPGEAVLARFTANDAFDLLKLKFIGQRAVTQFEISPPRENATVTALRAGDTIRVEYTLRARRANLDDHTFFAHLVDGTGRTIAQYDAPPFQGTYPTSLWDNGEVVSDAFSFAVPSNTAAGMYSLEFGIYSSADLARLPINGNDYGSIRSAGDHLILTPIEIE